MEAIIENLVVSEIKNIETEKPTKLPFWLYCALTRKQLNDAISNHVLKSTISAPLILTKTRQQLQQIRKPRTVLLRVAAQAAAQNGMKFEPIKGGYHVSKLPLEYISCSKLSGRYEKLLRVDCAGGVVLRTKQDPEVLLLLKAEGDNMDWVLPKGRRKPGETRQQTALREVQEETGLTSLKIKKFLGREGYFVVSKKNVTYKRITYYLMYNLESNVSLNVQETEGFIDGSWVTLSEAFALTRPTRAHNVLTHLTAGLSKEKTNSKSY